jgi:hypothetical protein
MLYGFVSPLTRVTRRTKQKNTILSFLRKHVFVKNVLARGQESKSWLKSQGEWHRDIFQRTLLAHNQTKKASMVRLFQGGKFVPFVHLRHCCANSPVRSNRTLIIKDAAAAACLPRWCARLSWHKKGWITEVFLHRAFLEDFFDTSQW